MRYEEEAFKNSPFDLDIRYEYFRACVRAGDPPVEYVDWMRYRGFSLVFQKDMKKLTIRRIPISCRSKINIDFYGLHSPIVETINILSPQLKSLENIEYLNFPNLSNLDISWNPIRTLKYLNQDQFPKLNYIKSSGCILTTFKSIRHLKKLKYLDIRGCTQMKTLKGLEDLVDLETLSHDIRSRVLTGYLKKLKTTSSSNLYDKVLFLVQSGDPSICFKV